jgi:hypothetical protein
MIEVLGYENPSAQHTSDANWLTCRVEIHVRSFSGEVDAAFTTQDFVEFARSLRFAVADVKGTAVFETDENALQLRVEFGHTGTARVSGTLREADRPQTSLTFSFESDQTSTPRGRRVHAARRCATFRARQRSAPALSTHERGAATLAGPPLRSAAPHLLALRSGFFFLRAIACSTPDGLLRFAPHWPNALDEVEQVLLSTDGAAGRLRKGG